MSRYLLTVCLVLVGCASTNTSKPFIDGPIKVTCEGRTFEQAKSQCFSNAIEFAVGAVVVTDSEVSKRKLVKDDILKYSAGYVDSYTIENRLDEPNRVLLAMDVKVKNSKIAERIMNVQNSNGEVQGPRMGAQYTTFMKNKETGDKLLKQVLNDYPKFGLKVEKGDVKYQVNVNRQPVIVVPYKVSWNYQYLQALNEVLSLTQDPKDKSIIQQKVSVSAKDPKAWLLGSTDSYYFNDTFRANTIKQTFVTPIFVNIKFFDQSGKLLMAGCDSEQYFAGPNITDPFTINGNYVLDEEMYVTVRNNKHKIQYIHEVQVSLTTTRCTIIE